MAVTQRSLERQLGMNVDSLITDYPVCPDCGTLLSLAQFNALETPECSQDGCEGTIYELKMLANKTTKRVPFVFVPHVSLKASLQLLFLRPGMDVLVQHWRRAEDLIGEVPLMSRTEWHDSGWAWRAEPARLERTLCEETGRYEDTLLGDPVRLSGMEFGLNLALNFDGFRVHSSWARYSSTAVYITINNLPRHLRLLTENTLLVAVLPSRREPSAYMIDQWLGPLINEIKELGINISMHRNDAGGPVDTTIYGNVGSLMVDYMARIKACGHTGIRSNRNFCLYCRKRLASTGVRTGYVRQPGAGARSTSEGSTSACGCRIPAQTSARHPYTKHTVFDTLPNWFSPSRAPLDGMHLFFLNIVPHVWKDILVSPGMLNRIPGDEHVLDPGERLDACLARAFFPSHIGRMPPTVRVGTRPKAEQYQTLISVLPVILFEAFRWVADGRRGLKPDLEDCMPSRDPGLYWAQVARLSIVVRILFSLQLSLSDASYATGILECFCCNFMRMNVHLVPSFHMALHVEETVAQFGALQNSWVWGFERANQSLTQTNKNGHRDGIMERTMMRRWWKAHGIFGLVSTFSTTLAAPSYLFYSFNYSGIYLIKPRRMYH
ncbi:hypothetical protein BDV93DRAFT_456989 [Ceratobasidium sp. AG-I]|nr:hypothetical protein BDV93DRAFT_456989 [Ceratobasidium sp. AG-I]